MKWIIYIFFIGGVLDVNGQNLVKNSGFEEFWKLQQLLGYGKIDTFYCKNWYLPNESTVDYYRKGNFLELSNGKIIHVLDVPHNFLGYHPAISGDAYIGFIPISTVGGMEHIIGELDQELLKNKVYEISFYIQHGGDSIQYNSNKIEVKFFSESDFFNDKNPFDTKYGFDMFKTLYTGIFEKSRVVADISYDLCQVNDSKDWVKVKGQFVAKGGERYIGLGLFYQGEELKEVLRKYMINKKEKRFLRSQSIIKRNKTYVEPSFFSGNRDNTYYFIDEVRVDEL